MEKQKDNTGKHVKQVVPKGKRLVVKDAEGRKVFAFEPETSVDQQLPLGYEVELVDVKPPKPPTPVDPFDRLPPRLLIEAVMELATFTREQVVEKAQQIRQSNR